MAGPRRAASTDEGALDGARMLVVEARYYEGIADELLAGAKRALEAAHAQYDVATVPGALEIPQAIVIALDAAAKRKAPYDGVVALGCVIRGETEHFRLVADAAAQGLLRVALDSGVPVLNGVLAVEDMAQAEARSGGAHGNAGSQAALAAIRMANLARVRGTG